MYELATSLTIQKVTHHSPTLYANKAPEKAPMSTAKACQTPYLNGGKSYLPQEVEIQTQRSSAPYPPQNNAPHPENQMTKKIKPGNARPKLYSYHLDASSLTKVK